jgi:hypothetical protein
MTPWTRIDRVAATLIAGVSFAILAASSSSLGFTRDEGYYFKAAHQYAVWWGVLFRHPFEAVSSATIQQLLSYNPEHPFLLKGLFAAALCVRDALGIPVAEHTAMRSVAWMAASFTAVMVFVLSRRFVRTAWAVLATALIACMPHVFWHAHVACFDVAVVGAHVTLVWAWMAWADAPSSSTRQSLWRATGFAVVAGVCLATKHNVWLVPVLLALCSLATHQRRLLLPWWWWLLPTVGFAVYVLLWPYLWPDIFGRLANYVAFHLHHEHYPISYFGDLLEKPPFPWLFPVVMSAVTVPVTILLVLAVGMMRTLASMRSEPAQRRHLAVLWANMLLPVLLIALPSTPIFGGTKHWMNALPFACVLAVIGVSRLIRRRHVAWVGVAVLVPAVASIVHTWPYGLGSYNELAGFERGAADIGMQRTFWGYEIRSSLSHLQMNTGKLHPGDVNPDSIHQYQLDGLLPAGVRYEGSVARSDAAFVEPQGEFKQQMIDVWNAWGRRPTHIVDVDGVPVGVWQHRPR